MPASRRTAPPPTRGGAGQILALAALPALASCAQISEVLPFMADTPPAVTSVTAPRIDAPPPTNSEQARVAPGSADDDPARLMGLDPTQLTGMLGEPAFVRRDGGGEIWQYRDSACVLHLFLYRVDKAARVEHVELRQADDGTALGTPAAERSCFGELLLRTGAV